MPSQCKAAARVATTRGLTVPIFNAFMLHRLHAVLNNSPASCVDAYHVHHRMNGTLYKSAFQSSFHTHWCNKARPRVALDRL